jgi:hypothetical protein
MFHEHVAQAVFDAALLHDPLQLQRDVGEAFAASPDV